MGHNYRKCYKNVLSLNLLIVDLLVREADDEV